MIITTGFTDLSAEAHRNQTAALLAPGGALDTLGTPTGLGVVGGVSSGFLLTGGAALVGTIAPGRAVIPSSTAEGGAYVVTMTEPENVSLEPGDGVYSRYDLVYLQIDEVPAPPEPPLEGEPEPDPEYFPGATIKVLKGTGVTGTTTPPVPDTPANAVPLWAVKILPTTSEASGYVEGTVLDRRARLKLVNQDRQPFSMAAGNVNVAMVSARNYGSAAISFPAGRFRVPPVCVASLASAPGNSGKVSARVINATPNGATIMCYTGDNLPMGMNTTLIIHWHAVQMSEDAAMG